MTTLGRNTGTRAALLALAAALALLASMIATAPRAAAAQLTYTYEVRGKGNTTSLEDFAARAAETYANPDGWALGGSIAFVRVPSGGNFTLWLSAPQYLPSFSPGCSTEYSCRVGRNVIINEARFRGGSAAWNATGASLRDYQHMVVNHETGHWLGFGHASCPGPGQLAPLMQQQSKAMGGCRPNAWPTAGERETLSRWKGVPIIPTRPPLIPAGSVVTVPAAGTGGIPANAKAVGLNLTVTEPAGPGFITAFPCGSPLPPTSNLNFATGQTLAAFTLATPGTGGAVCVRTSQSVHLIIDVSGYVPAGASYTPVVPTRLLDTRTTGAMLDTSGLRVQLPAGAAAAALTVTVTAPTASGFVTVYPCDRPRPLASTVNFPAGADIANMSLTAVGADGRVCFFSNVRTHLVVDLVATLPAGSGFTAVTPQRLYDSRTLAAGVTSAAFPTSGGVHALNLTITEPTSAGWARIFPCDGPEPSTSNINFTAGQTVANAAITPGSNNGWVCVRSLSATHIVVDDSGSLNPAEYLPVPAVRLLDSRKR